MNNNGSRRIASNTMMLFARMFILMLANLYAVRLLIQGLGDNDYGIFTTVAGVVTTTAFLSSILAFAVQRFYSVALGERDLQKSKDIFSASLNIAVGGSVLILVFLETAGVWFVTHHLVIPEARMEATQLAFQFSIFTFLLTFVQVPYLAAIYANEDMGVYSVVSTVDGLGRVAASWIITRVAIDRLSLYAFLILVLSLVVFLCYAAISIRRYPECRYTSVKDKNIYRQLISFSGWYSFGSLANTGLNQGNTILLNIFFGPLANAAFGVATQIQNAFNSLSNSIVLPFRPPMIKAYAEGDHESVNSMFQANNKVICYFMLAVGLPIMAEMRTILQLWLGMNDDMTVIFSQMMVASVIVISLHNPISIIIHATGRVRQYHVPVESLILLCFPVTLILFKSGCQAVVLFYSMLGLVVVAHCVRIYILRRNYPQFSLSRYVWAFLLPASIVAACSSAITYAVHCSVQGDIPRMIAVFTLSPSAVMLLAYTIGITGSERKLANRFLTKTFRKKTDDIID